MELFEKEVPLASNPVPVFADEKLKKKLLERFPVSN